MFGNKPEENNLNLTREKDYGLDEVPIFTMKNDLKSIEDSKYKDFAGNNSMQMQPSRPQNDIRFFSEKQKTSPFLSQAIPEKKETAPKSQVQFQSKVPSKAEPNKDTKWQKLLFMGISIFFILVLSAGGYYFWITKQSAKEENAPLTQIPPKENTVTFSIEKPNYLSVDINNFDNAKIKETLEKYADKVSLSGVLTPVEFIITDEKNNPVSFEDFSSKIGISFSPGVFSGLSSEKSFSLFIYNDNDKARFGLAIDSKDDYKLQEAIFQEELDLPGDLNPLLRNISYDTTGKIFSTGSYAGTEIRYLNLTTPDDLSIDYSIFNNKLIIGTTKMTIQSIMDYISSHSEAKGAEITDTEIIEQ